jgi:hypothetical protein
MQYIKLYALFLSDACCGLRFAVDYAWARLFWWQPLLSKLISVCSSTYLEALSNNAAAAAFAGRAGGSSCSGSRCVGDAASINPWLLSLFQWCCAAVAGLVVG